MKKVTLILFFFLFILSTNSQTISSPDIEEAPKLITDVINQIGIDTVIFYYNNDWHLVRPVCSSIFRVSQIDTVFFTFTNFFTDFYSDSTKAVEGNYTNGKKEGDFKLYFPNGQIEQFGKYSNDKKNGVWEYYYANGKKHQVLDFKESEILIISFWDENGKQLTDSGTGEWFTFESQDKFTKISGSVVNGRKNGTWKKSVSSKNFVTNSEKYKDGKLISGKMFALIGSTEAYKDTAYCFIEKDLPFVSAEQFIIDGCRLQTNDMQSNNSWAFAEYPGGVENFYQEIRERFILSENNTIKGTILVQTTIDERGKMTNFLPISSIGLELELIRVLKTMSNWNPTKINGEPTTQTKVIRFVIR